MNKKKDLDENFILGIEKVEPQEVELRLEKKISIEIERIINDIEDNNDDQGEGVTSDLFQAMIPNDESITVKNHFSDFWKVFSKRINNENIFYLRTIGSLPCANFAFLLCFFLCIILGLIVCTMIFILFLIILFIRNQYIDT